MRYRYEDWLVDLVRRDSKFLRKMGIKRCVTDEPCPELLMLAVPRGPQVRLTVKDAQWLKACGVAWEPGPAFQLPLGFCASQEAVPGAYPFAEVRMKKECSSCHGTGKCQLCKGTGHFGYPGVGPVDMYPTQCSTCQGSGDCRACRGTGQR
jgi:hypothetical protein